MATYTTNLNLKKPDGTDEALISDINSNMDLIDTAISTLHGLSEASTTLEEDLNDCIYAGTYIFGTSTSHKPEDFNYGLCFVIATNQPTSTGTGWVYQLAFCVDANTNGMYIRKNINQTGWTSWQSVVIE